MGQSRNIYVRDDDLELWAQAEAYAKARRLSMSALIMTALESYLEREQDVSAGQAE